MIGFAGNAYFPIYPLRASPVRPPRATGFFASRPDRLLTQVPHHDHVADVGAMVSLAMSVLNQQKTIELTSTPAPA